MVVKITKKIPKSVFIICKAGSDIRTVIDVFRELGIVPLNGTEAVGPGEPLSQTTTALIDKAALVCAILDNESVPYIYWELGYAHGRDIPTIIISGTNHSALPSDFPSKYFIKVPLDDAGTLRFHLKVFVENIILRSARKNNAPTLKPSTSTTTKTLSHSPGSYLEAKLLHDLEASEEIKTIAPQPQDFEGRSYIPDFAIWLTGSTPDVRSPVIIEIKGPQHPRGRQEGIIQQLSAYAQTSDTPTVLLVIDDDLPEPIRLVSLSPLFFVVSYSHLRGLLTHGALLSTLVTERNRFAHSAG